MVIQWVKLFPVARLRVNDQRLADRLEQLLRNLHAKYTKIPRSSLVLATIEEISEKLRSQDYLAEVRNFLTNTDNEIKAREIEMDQKEQEEHKSQRTTGSSTNMKKNKVGMASASNLLSVPGAGTSGKRPGS